jgi:hypothetical protein
MHAMLLLIRLKTRVSATAPPITLSLKKISLKNQPIDFFRILFYVRNAIIKTNEFM